MSDEAPVILKVSCKVTGLWLQIKIDLNRSLAKSDLRAQGILIESFKVDNVYAKLRITSEEVLQSAAELLLAVGSFTCLCYGTFPIAIGNVEF